MDGNFCSIWIRFQRNSTVKGFKESERSRYVTDAEFDKVRTHAHFTVIDAMDLALLTGQRPADVIKLRCSDIRNGALCVVQNKTGERLKRRLGQSSIESCLEVAGRMNLRGSAGRLYCPLLLVHGLADCELPLSQAQRTFDECAGSIALELSVRTPADGGADHAGIDDPRALARHVVDWIPSALAAHTSSLLNFTETP